MGSEKRKFNMTTASHGHPLDEVVSALQKEIRRGKEREALYWAVEMLPNYEAYLWRRLKIIANEDIGVANPIAIILVEILEKQYFEFRKKPTTDSMLMLTNAVMYLCRSKKTREGCHLVNIIQQIFSQNLEPGKKPPDYAIDEHTKKGRKIGRGDAHFREEGALLIQDDGEPTPKDQYEDECYKILKNGVKWFYNDSAMKNYQNRSLDFKER
jgi:replication-associated recombination protein RarA